MNAFFCTFLCGFKNNIEPKKKDSPYVYECKELVTFNLHNKIIPVPSAKKLSEFIQRIPIVTYVVSDADSSVQLVIFHPASNTRRTLQLNLRISFEQINDFFRSDTEVHLPSTNYLFLHYYTCSNMIYIINNLSSTNVQQKQLKTQIPCTIRNYSNRLNHQIDFSSSHKRPNELRSQSHNKAKGYTPVRGLHHSSNSRATAPS